MAKDNKRDKEKDYNYALMGLVLLVAIIGLMMALWSPITPTVNIVTTEPFNQAGYAALGRCTDYDSGKDTKAYNTASYVTDKDGIHTDECLASGLLRENYCLVKGKTSSWKYIDFNCPLGCNGGACKTCGDGVKNHISEGCDGTDLNGMDCTRFGFDAGTLKCYLAGTENECKFDTSGCVALPLAECTDTDSGIIANTIGATFGKDGGRAIDKCKGNNLLEYSCGNIIEKKQIFILLPSNNKIEYMSYSSTTSTVALRDITEGMDYRISVDSNGMFEFVLGGTSYFFTLDMVSNSYISSNNSVILETEIDCPSSICEAGACVNQLKCTDTDNGRFTEIVGTTAGEFGGVTDRCSSPSTVKEHYCSNYITEKQSFIMGPSNSEFTYMSYSLSSKTVAFRETDVGDTRVSVNSNGQFEFVVGGISYFFILEDVAMGNSPLYSTRDLIVSEKIPCPSRVCQAGACTHQNICTDTDGGLDYYTKGSASSNYGGTTYDGCQDNMIVEAYCVDGEVSTVEFTCPNGCDGDGACIA